MWLQPYTLCLPQWSAAEVKSHLNTAPNDLDSTDKNHKDYWIMSTTQRQSEYIFIENLQMDLYLCTLSETDYQYHLQQGFYCIVCTGLNTSDGRMHGNTLE